MGWANDLWDQALGEAVRKHDDQYYAGLTEKEIIQEIRAGKIIPFVQYGVVEFDGQIVVHKRKAVLRSRSSSIREIEDWQEVGRCSTIPEACKLTIMDSKWGLLQIQNPPEDLIKLHKILWEI